MSTKIAVAGLGYVGLSNAILLAQKNRVTAVDIDPARVALVNAGRSPVQDPDCADWLARGTLIWVPPPMRPAPMPGRISW